MEVGARYQLFGCLNNFQQDYIINQFPCDAPKIQLNLFFLFTTTMAGRSGKPDLSGYNYGAISSLVLTTDRSALPRRDKEPDGAPVSLAGRIDVKDMGSRVQRQAPKDLEKKKKKAVEGAEPIEKASAKRKAEATGFGYADIIEATQDVEGLTYRPRTAETRQVYELILAAVHSAIGDQAQDIVRSAADTVLEVLKTDSLKDFDKKKEIETVLGTIPNEQFSQLVSLSKKITDYNADDETMGDPDKEAEIDEEGGVAVVFDEEEQEEEDEEGFEIKEDSDEEDGEDERQEDEDREMGEEDQDDDLVIGGDASRDTKVKSEKDIVSPHSIDGFWVQRQISEVYPDPVTAADKAASVLSILGSESSARDCENQLMELFDYQSFHITAKFLKNRDVIVWCTKLMRSDADERVNVEVAMREKGLGWILRELAGDRQAKSSANVSAMDVDKPAVVPKTATLAPGSTVQPRRTVDLESMAFSQGGHLMSNKKCKLPDGSFKRAKKGYEEIHVPAPKQKPVTDGELVPITTLPKWAQAAFTVKTLNRVQSKLYPIAFGTDEPILLCAPTGAGKVYFSFF